MQPLRWVWVARAACRIRAIVRNSLTQQRLSQSDAMTSIGFGALQIEPFVGLSYESLTASTFREIDGVAALANAGTRSSQTFSTLGTRGSMVFDVTSMTTTLRGALWRHAFNDVTPGSTFAFSGGVPFNISSIAIARDAAVVEAGMDVAIRARVTLGINYTGQYANVVGQAIDAPLALSALKVESCAALMISGWTPIDRWSLEHEMVTRLPTRPDPSRSTTLACGMWWSPSATMPPRTSSTMASALRAVSKQVLTPEPAR